MATKNAESKEVKQQAPDPGSKRSIKKQLMKHYEIEYQRRLKMLKESPPMLLLIDLHAVTLSVPLASNAARDLPEDALLCRSGSNLVFLRPGTIELISAVYHSLNTWDGGRLSHSIILGFLSANEEDVAEKVQLQFERDFSSGRSLRDPTDESKLLENTIACKISDAIWRKYGILPARSKSKPFLGERMSEYPILLGCKTIKDVQERLTKGGVAYHAKIDNDSTSYARQKLWATETVRYSMTLSSALRLAQHAAAMGKTGSDVVNLEVVFPAEEDHIMSDAFPRDDDEEEQKNADDMYAAFSTFTEQVDKVETEIKAKTKTQGQQSKRPEAVEEALAAQIKFERPREFWHGKIQLEMQHTLVISDRKEMASDNTLLIAPISDTSRTVKMFEPDQTLIILEHNLTRNIHGWFCRSNHWCQGNVPRCLQLFKSKPSLRVKLETKGELESWQYRGATAARFESWNRREKWCANDLDIMLYCNSGKHDPDLDKQWCWRPDYSDPENVKIQVFVKTKEALAYVQQMKWFYEYARDLELTKSGKLPVDSGDFVPGKNTGEWIEVVLDATLGGSKL